MKYRRNSSVRLLRREELLERLAKEGEKKIQTGCLLLMTKRRWKNVQSINSMHCPLTEGRNFEEEQTNGSLVRLETRYTRSNRESPEAETPRYHTCDSWYRKLTLPFLTTSKARFRPLNRPWNGFIGMLLTTDDHHATVI